MKLTKKDYTSILKYYKINYENLTSLQIKKNAESILATKLCKCIKKVINTRNISVTILLLTLTGINY